MLFKIVVLKIFAIFTGKHLYWNKFMKSRLQRRCFSLNIVESFFYIAPPVAASGCLRCFPSLLFLTFSIFPFRSSQQKCYIKKAVFKFLQYSQENTFVEGLQLYWKETLTQVVSCKYGGIFKNIYRLLFIRKKFIRIKDSKTPKT